MTLNDVPIGKTCTIIRIKNSLSMKQRLIELGFTKGEKVTVIKNAPLGDPVELKIKGYYLSLRKSDLNQIEVTI